MMVLNNPTKGLQQAESSSFIAILCSFHSFFKVLFTFPSQYLFTIGIFHIFSLRNLTNFHSLKLQSQTT